MNKLKSDIEYAISAFPHKDTLKRSDKELTLADIFDNRKLDRFKQIFGRNLNTKDIVLEKVEKSGNDVVLYKYGNCSFYETLDFEELKNQSGLKIPRIYVTETDDKDNLIRDMRFNFNLGNQITRKAVISYDLNGTPTEMVINNNPYDQNCDHERHLYINKDGNIERKTERNNGITNEEIYELKVDENSSEKP